MTDHLKRGSREYGVLLMEQCELCELQRNRPSLPLSMMPMERHEELRRGGVIDVPNAESAPLPDEQAMNDDS